MHRVAFFIDYISTLHFPARCDSTRLHRQQNMETPTDAAALIYRSDATGTGYMRFVCLTPFMMRLILILLEEGDYDRYCSAEMRESS